MSFLDDLRARARSRAGTLVFPEGTDPRTGEAVRAIVDAGLATPVLLGPEARVRAGLEATGVDADRIRVDDPSTDEERWTEVLAGTEWGKRLTPARRVKAVHDPLVRGALMVRDGEVDGSVAGAAHPSPDVIRAAIRCVGPAPGIETVSSSFYMQVRPFRGPEPEVLTFSDAGVIRDPDAGALAEIAVAAARARRLVVGDEPRVAFLSYSTLGSADGPSVSRTREALDRFRELEPDVEADGELQADAALIESVARRKAPASPVAGRANVLIFPNLDAGNIGYKLVERLGDAAAMGPILQGLHRPCNDLSRGAEAEDIVNVACITAVMAGNVAPGHGS